MAQDKSSVAIQSHLHDFLIRSGTTRVVHSGRLLYEHLTGVESVLRAWQQPEDLCAAGLFHSIYSTDRFRHVTLPISGRIQLQSLIGEKAERLVYLFAVLERRALFEASDACVSFSAAIHFELPSHEAGAESVPISGEELAQLVILHLANRLEQASKPITRIGYALAFMSERIETLRRAGETLPKPLARLQRVTFDGERRLNSFYLQGMSCLERGDPGPAIPVLERACEEFGVVGEPFVMLALAQRWMEEPDAARKTAAKGLELLCDWGTPWHKRFSMDEWCRLANVLREGGAMQEITKALRGLFGAHDEGRKDAGLEPRDISLGTSEQAAVYRFFSYLKTIKKERSKSSVKWYPGLGRKPWYDPRDFSVARRLEQAYAEIRAEAERVAPSSYYEEAEEIGRVGNWQVCMFYEQGRRDDYISAQCPTIASILDSDPCVRRSSGLIYLSKMAPQTHLAPHHAGTNMRLRCHLAISIPAGDCAIRVGGSVRQWEEGKCIVFDDTFEHEVWNRTDQERLVLLTDLWHPDLSDFERDALETMNWLGLWQADSLLATWERNDRQRETEGKRVVAQRGYGNLRPNR